MDKVSILVSLLC